MKKEESIPEIDKSYRNLYKQNMVMLIVSEAIFKKLEANSIVSCLDAARSWLSLPGIGIKTAATLIAFTGDISRFDSADQLKNYALLCRRRTNRERTTRSSASDGAICMPIRRNIIQGGWSVMFSIWSTHTHYSHLLLKRRKSDRIRPLPLRISGST